MSECMGDPYAAQIRAAKAEGELARIKDELREFAEDNGFNPEMEPRDLLAKATGSFRSCAAMSDARYEEIRELKAEMEAMRPHLMPEGVEWPRYEDGEPVMLNDVALLANGLQEEVYQVHFHGSGFALYTETSDVDYSYGERVKRPAVGGADGAPIREGDTVWCVATDEQLLDMNVSIVRGLNRGRELTVTDVTQRGGEPWARFEQTGFLIKTCYLTHAKPDLDSWERIEEDTEKSFSEYWGCEEVECSRCPALIDGKTPHEFFGCSHNCTIAMKRDIMRRCKALAGVSE